MSATMIFYSSSYQPDACCSIVRNESTPAYLYDGLRCCPLISSSWFSFARFWFRQSWPPQERTLEAHRRDARWKSSKNRFIVSNNVGVEVAKTFLVSMTYALGALGGTRTPTILLTATSRQRVYQFRHERLGYRVEPSGPPDRRRPCNK